MKLSEYILLSREERTSHIDLSSPCELIAKSRWSRSKDESCDFHEVFNDVENWMEGDIHRCHLCDNNSTTNLVCVNPLHFYIGTPQENRLDVPAEVRSEGAKGPKSEECKEKLRQKAILRGSPSEESRRKQSIARTGLVQSEATKRKRSESIKQWWKQRKQNASL